MRVGIFYIDTSKNYSGWTVVADGKENKDAVGIRMEVVEAEDEVAAMDMAQPRDNESVMNAHELRVPRWDED